MLQDTKQAVESSLSTWLSFVSTLIWQLVIIVILWYLRGEIRLLLKRVAKVKYGDTEIAFQEESPSAIEPGGKAAKQVALVGPDGFFTKEGAANLIQESELIDKDDRVTGVLLLFRTERQRTWLVATTQWLFCVLDDENTRKTKKLIQWQLPLSEANPIVARASKPERGSVDIGPRKSWLYSYSLFPEPEQVEDVIRALIEKAQRGSASHLATEKAPPPQGG